MAKIGLVQLDIQWENVEGNIARVRELLEPHDDLDLVVLPELWSVGFTMNQDAHKAEEKTVQAMCRISKEKGSYLVGGVPVGVPGGQQNRAFFVAKGEVVGSYAKNKVFSFAGEHHRYLPGKEIHTWPCAGFEMTPLVCYDLRFPELARSVMPRTQLLIYIANWPTARIAHWQRLLPARALENLSYVIGVNRVGSDPNGNDYPGSAMLVDPSGEVLAQGENRECVITAHIEPERVEAIRKQWPFLNDLEPSS